MLTRASRPFTVPASALECRSLWRTFASGPSGGGLRSWTRSPEKERSAARARNSGRGRSCRPERPPPQNRSRLERRSESCTPAGPRGLLRSARSPAWARTAGRR